VVPFKSTYHVIFGRPAFHSFHAWPCYIYNQLKMLGPDGIITIYGSFRRPRSVRTEKPPSRSRWQGVQGDPCCHGPREDAGIQAGSFHLPAHLQAYG
jgi:hypothetical protein